MSDPSEPSPSEPSDPMAPNIDDLAFFTPRMPTPAEMRQSALAWQAVAGPTMLCQWPADLMALSASTTFVELPRNNEALFDQTTFAAHATPIAAEIDAILGFERRFFRLNSRSPKDAPLPLEIPVSCSGKEILSVIAASERCLTDLSPHSPSKSLISLS